MNLAKQKSFDMSKNLCLKLWSEMCSVAKWDKVSQWEQGLRRKKYWFFFRQITVNQSKLPVSFEKRGCKLPVQWP